VVTDGTEAGTFSILRVRPPELTAEGPQKDELLDVATAALGAASELRTTSTFLLPAAIDLSPFDASVIEDLTERLHEAAREDDAVIVDLRFDRTQVRFGAVERLLLEVAGNIAPVWVRGAYLVFLVTRLPDPEDDLARVLDFPQLEQCTLFVDDDGNTLGSAGQDWEQADAVKAAATPSASQERDAALRQAQRRRGVFKVATSHRDEYSAHKYSLPASDLSRLLAGYFTATGIDIAVLDGVASPWLDEALFAVGADASTQVSCFSSEDLIPDANPDQLNMHTRLAKLLADGTKAVSLVVPMVKQGDRLRELQDQIQSLGASNVRVLTIFIDSEAEETLSADGWASQVVHGGTPVDFFFKVALTRLEAHAWPVRMAKFFHEDVTDKPPWRPSRVGLWMMFDELERTAGYTQSDHGVLMRMELDHWDAGWLADCLMRQLDHESSPSKANMLFVVPDDEESAIGSIVEALKTQQGVAVVALSRPVLNGEEEVSVKVADQLRRYRNGEIILVDESTARYRTMTKLRRVVFNVLQRSPNGAVVILELPEGNEKRPDNLQSMLSWRPINRATTESLDDAYA
jgi:hypothetical protein